MGNPFNYRERVVFYFDRPVEEDNKMIEPWLEHKIIRTYHPAKFAILRRECYHNSLKDKLKIVSCFATKKLAQKGIKKC